MKPVWSTTAQWILRIAFALRCLGLGFKYLWHEFEGDSTIFSTLLFDWEFSETIAQRVDDASVYAMVCAGAVLLVTGCLRFMRLDESNEQTNSTARIPWLTRLDVAALSVAIFYEFVLPLSKINRGGELLSEWSLVESALRISIPIALLLIVVNNRLQPTEWVLRVATALTFAIHGYKAWIAAGEFVAMIYATFQNLLIAVFENPPDFWPEQSHVELILKGIAIADLLVAVLIILRRWPRVALYAAIWGLITACARTTSSSFGWPDTLLRAAHVGGPLILYLQWQRLYKATGTSKQPAPNDGASELTAR